MSDDRDFLDRVNASRQNWTGEDRSSDDVVNDFHLYGHAKRAEALDQLDEAYAASDTSDLKQYAKLTGMRRQLRDIHHTLRKAGR